MSETATDTIATPEINQRMVDAFRKVANAIALEAAQEFAPSYVDPRESQWDQSPHHNLIHTRPYLQSAPADRQDGRYLPVYDTESDLRILRAMTRMMAETVPAAKTILERLCDYTVATGYDYQITPSDGEKKNALSQRAVRIWEQFAKDNAWLATGEREAFQISHEEGEWLAWPEASGGGIELCDATTDEITEPSRVRDLELWLSEEHGFVDHRATWAFGVHRRPGSRRIHGFHIVRDSVGADWDYVRGDRSVWIKRYTPSRANRGVSAFYLPHQYLQRSDKVYRNTAEGAAIQAAIAYIVEHAAGITGRQVENLTASNAIVSGLARSYTQTRSGASVPDSVSGIAPGSVPHVNNGQKVHAGPLGSVNSDIYLNVMQAGLRMCGALWAMPEGMITGDWSNGTYSSTEIAEGPYMKGREADQVLTGEAFEKLVWAVLRVAYQMGMFRGVAGDWEQVEHGLNVKAEGAAVHSRNLYEEAQRMEIERRNEVISLRSWRVRAGYDADEEEEQIQLERKSGTKPTPQPTAFGQTTFGQPAIQPKPEIPSPGSTPATESRDDHDNPELAKAALECRRLSDVMHRKAGLEASTRQSAGSYP